VSFNGPSMCHTIDDLEDTPKGSLYVSHRCPPKF
jgi:hypothetical protein